MTAYLVRHAKAGSRERWTRPDHERPLTDAGWRQAEGLVQLLDTSAIRRVLSSPYVRCVQTVEPLAKACGVRVETDDRLVEGADPDEALQLMADSAGAVFCSHGDIIAGVILGANEHGAHLAPGIAWSKGSTWALQLRAGAIVSGRYIPPP